MAKIVRLTESDINKLIKKIINEDDSDKTFEDYKKEIDGHINNLKTAFNQLKKINHKASNDKSLTDKQKDKIDWKISQTLDDLFAAFDGE